MHAEGKAFKLRVLEGNFVVEIAAGGSTATRAAAEVIATT